MGKQTELSVVQRGLLWGIILIISLGFFIAGLILTLRSIDDKNTTPEIIRDEALTTKMTTKMTTEDVTRPTQSPATSRTGYGEFRHAAVAIPSKVCNTIGSEMMAKHGGSAVDAAIASLICAGVVNFYGSGIGGGQFLTIYDMPNNGTEKMFNVILGRERAPAAATEDMFLNGTVSSVRGGQAIGIPGEIKGFHHAWKKFGRIPWKILFNPSIELCKSGVVIGERTAWWIQRYEELIRNTPNMRDMLIKGDGSIVQEGDIVTRPLLASTLTRIADDPTAFYDPANQLALDVVADIQEAGGIITLDDLANYEVYDKAPLSVHLSNGNYTVYGPPPPSGAVVVEYILNILDEYNLNEDNIADTEAKVLTYHRIAEAFKYGYARRTELADEDFIDIVDLLANMTSDNFAEETMYKVNDDRTYDVEHYEPVYSTEDDAGTVHVSILASDGSAVAGTSTINYAFGSFVVGNRTGIIFNNEMDDFSTPGLVNVFGYRPSPANYIKPGKMPLSSMSPIIIADGKGDVFYVSGGSGGSKIISSVAYAAIHSLWLGKRVDEAIELPRLHHQLVPNFLYTGDGFDVTVADGLAEKGHNVTTTSHNPVESIHNKCTGSSQEMYDKTECIEVGVGYYYPVDPDGY